MHCIIVLFVKLYISRIFCCHVFVSFVVLSLLDCLEEHKTMPFPFVVAVAVSFSRPRVLL